MNQQGQMTLEQMRQQQGQFNRSQPQGWERALGAISQAGGTAAQFMPGAPKT
jgi:hypothetical protein